MVHVVTARVVKQTIGQNRHTRRNNLRVGRLEAKVRVKAVQRGVAKHLFPTVDDLNIVSEAGTVRRATTAEQAKQHAAEDRAAKLRAKILEREVAVVTTPGQPGYRGEYDCSDCCSMSHCETHHKDEGTYPFDEIAAASTDANLRMDNLDRPQSQAVTLATDVLKEYFPDRRVT